MSQKDGVAGTTLFSAGAEAVHLDAESGVVQALLELFIFLGGPLRAGLQALEFTVPIFWSYLAMTAFAISFAIPMAKWLGLSGSLFGLIGSQILFQSTVGAALLMKSRRVEQQQAALVSHFPAAAE